MDSAVIKTKFDDVKLVQTTDFFYPNVEDPYQQGKIACANVLSDLYAMGVYDCDNMLMLLAVCSEMTPNEKEVITRLMIQGFNDQAQAAGCVVTGGQTVVNPWVIIGGVASSVCRTSDIIMPTGARPGDVLVLTKPLGTQVAVNAHQWLQNQFKKPENWQTIVNLITVDEVNQAYETAQKSMARLNRTAARLMHQHHAHAATDITGFGLLGHSRNLAENQTEAVDFFIHTLPTIRHMVKVNQKRNFKLTLGLSAETSGGLLIAMTKEDATAFIEQITQIDNHPAWIVGDVITGTHQSTIAENPTIIEI